MRRTTIAVWAVVLVACLAAGTLGAHSPPEGDRASSVGDLRFHASAVPFRHGPRVARAEFSIRIPYQEIHFIPEGDHSVASVQISASDRGWLQPAAVRSTIHKSHVARAESPETGRFECDDGLSDRPAIGRADRS